MKKILHVVRPIIAPYTTIASIISVLSTDTRSVSWFTNNFNQLCYTKPAKGERVGTIIEQHSPNDIEVFPDIEMLTNNVIAKDFVNIKWSYFTDLVVDSINSGYYLQTYLNNYYISYRKNHYMQSVYQHPTFIYGYDIDKQECYIADLYNGLPFDFYTLDFDSINKAYANESMNEYLFSKEVYMFKIKDDYKEGPIDVGYIKLRLEDFLNSKDTTEKFLRAERFIDNGFTYGLAYYDELINDISVGRLDVRSMHIICDYMKMMSYKLNVFKKNRIISEGEFEIINRMAEKLLAQVTTNRNLYLKKRITNSANALEFTNKLICSYQQIKLDNKEFVKEILAVI